MKTQVHRHCGGTYLCNDVTDPHLGGRQLFQSGHGQAVSIRMQGDGTFRQIEHATKHQGSSLLLPVLGAPGEFFIHGKPFSDKTRPKTGRQPSEEQGWEGSVPGMRHIWLVS